MRYQFFCLFVSSPLPHLSAAAGLLRTTLRFKDRFLPCATNTLVNTRQGRRFAQAALKLCGSLEQRRDLGACPTFISLNVELVACRTSTKRTKQHERQCGRSPDGGCRIDCKFFSGKYSR